MKKQLKRAAPVVSTITEQLLDYEGMAAVLGIPSRHLRQLVYEGVVPHLRLSYKVVRFEPSRVVAALRRREVREVG